MIAKMDTTKQNYRNSKDQLQEMTGFKENITGGKKNQCKSLDKSTG
jgi:hypothetical protein